MPRLRAAIIPAAITTESLTLLGEQLFDYRDFLTVGDGQALCLAWKTMAEINLAHGAMGLPFVVKGVLDSSMGIDSVVGSSTHKWCGFETSFFVNAPGVSQGDQRLRVHSRLARNMQRMKSEGCALKTFAGNNTTLIRTILQLKAAQDGFNLFRDPLRIEMVCAMARVSAENCEIFTLINGSTIVAALVSFIEPDCRRFYNTYYDKRWAKHSPGISLLHEIMQSNLEGEGEWDFMTGEQPYKQRFATFNKPLYTLCASPAALREIGDQLPQSESLESLLAA